MALHKPDGAGPFPALILHHQCAGLCTARGGNRSMAAWAERAVRRGYVVLMIDSLGSRGVDTVCLGPKGGVGLFTGVRDALQALRHLKKFQFVDKTRVAHLGFSWGAMVGLLASTRGNWSMVPGGDSFGAIISVYPACHTFQRGQGRGWSLVRDVGSPLLVLMGDRDDETPALECVEQLADARSTGAEVAWHVFPNATHCWDCEHLDGFSKLALRGSRVTYRYDRKTTLETERRIFEFLDRVWAGMPP